MQYQSEISTISRVAPPSYAEAMAQAATMKATAPPLPHAPTAEDLSYEQHPQVPPYTAAVSGSRLPATSFPISTVNPRIDSPYIAGSSIEPNPAPPCVVRVNRVVYKTRWKDRCCTPKVTASIFIFFLLVMIVKLLVSAS